MKKLFVFITLLSLLSLSVSGALTLTARGNGTSVATLSMRSSEDVTITLGCNAKFYTNSSGTEGESSTWTIVSGADRTIYIKCATCTASFTVSDETKITKWLNWDSNTTNGASIGGDISGFVNLTYLHTAWANSSNTLTGDITDLDKLTHLYIFGDNTLSGEITDWLDLELLQIGGSNTLSGSITNLTKAVNLDNISPYCTHTGDISDLTLLYYLWFYGNCNLTGSINDLTELNTLVITASNNITGDLANLHELSVMRMSGGNALTCSRLNNATGLSDFQLTSSATFTDSNIDQLISDMYANRNETKPYSGRVFRMNLNSASGTHTYAGTGFGYAFIMESEGWTVDILHTSLGSELIDQSNWYNLSYWNTAQSNWSTVNSKLRTTSSTGYLIKSSFWEIGSKYYIEITLTGVTAGANGLLHPYDGSTANFFHNYAAKFKFYYTPSATSLYIHNYNIVGDVSAISIKKVL